MTTRRAFIEQFGGTCDNWQWSWSFVNHEKRWIIFGAWEDQDNPNGDLIFTREWERNEKRKNPGFEQSLRHISLVENEGYALFTFPMVRGDAYPGTDNETAKIKSFTPELLQRGLRRVDGEWYATEQIHDQDFNEAMDVLDHGYEEGAKKVVTGHRYERDPKARALCVAIHGFDCAICGINLEDRYGGIAKKFIHVHHCNPISEMGGRYEIDPVKDLRPVCPNCHSIIHRRKPILSIEETRALLAK